MANNSRDPLVKTMLTTEELAIRIGISKKTLIRWRLEYGDGSNGVPRRGPRWIRATPTSHARVRYPLAWVEEWEQQRMDEAAA
jgi:DNA-binding XRE family transcriptional regulator